MSAGLFLPLLMAGVYVPLYSFAAYQSGYRLFSRARGLALWSGRAVCVRGPFDGVEMPVARRDLLGMGVGPWPNVLFNPQTKTYRLVSECVREACASPDIWAGYYMLRFMSDRYVWHGTGLEEFADLYPKVEP